MASFAIVDPRAVPGEEFDTCETEVRKLTEPLGCEEMRVNQVIVDPGEDVTPHAHEGQEEVYVAQTGGQIAVEGEVHDVPAGGVVRVHADTIRNLVNRTETETHRWIAVGAPPVGTVEDYGAYVVPDDVA